jgi:endonuclease/exonuclease/phosphatase family metal-dependent hydrolase
LLCIVAIVALLPGVIAIVGSLRMPTARLDVPPAGTVQPFAGHTLRVATYNIHSGVGEDDRFDLARTAADLKGFDLVGLNEIRGAFSAGGDQASQLGAILGEHAIFAPTENRWFHGHFGNGLLHRPDLDGYQRIPMAGSLGRGKRNVIQTRILTPGKPIGVLLTHIDRGADRAGQLQTVRQMFLSLPEPAILMGDMNSEKSDPLIAPLRTSPGVTDGIARILGDKDPSDRIDYIFTRGLKWRDGGLRDSKASDHPMIWGEMEVP